MKSGPEEIGLKRHVDFIYLSFNYYKLTLLFACICVSEAVSKDQEMPGFQDDGEILGRQK